MECHSLPCIHLKVTKIPMPTILLTFSRISLGLILLVFGANGFYTFIPVPEFHPFMEILVSSNYIYVIKFIELTSGILLLSNRFVPIGLAMIIPGIVNITAYHIFLDHRNWIVVPILLLLLIICVYGYRNYFKPLFAYKALPKP